MESYSISQWILFFYFYCFIGWIWESCYVSYEEKHWVNRGFLKGPMLPIYGFGAIIILLAVVPVKDNIIHVFIFGMIAATLLELVTGILMEKIFNVRYWDYTNEKFNYKGYICLLCSLAWGGFSILMIKVIHPIVDHLFGNLSIKTINIVIVIISILFIGDVIKSFYAAIDLKNLLLNLTENNELIKGVINKLELAQAFISEDLKDIEIKFKEKVELPLDNKEVLKKAKINTKESFEKLIERIKNARLEKLQGISDKINMYIDKLEVRSDKSQIYQHKLKSELSEALTKLKKSKKLIELSNNKIYKNSLNILKRNPKAKTYKYSEALDEIKKHIIKKDKNK